MSLHYLLPFFLLVFFLFSSLFPSVPPLLVFLFSSDWYSIFFLPYIFPVSSFSLQAKWVDCKYFFFPFPLSFPPFPPLLSPSIPPSLPSSLPPSFCCWLGNWSLKSKYISHIIRSASALFPASGCVYLIYDTDKPDHASSALHRPRQKQNSCKYSLPQKK